MQQVSLNCSCVLSGHAVVSDNISILYSLSFNMMLVSAIKTILVWVCQRLHYHYCVGEVYPVIAVRIACYIVIFCCLLFKVNDFEGCAEEGMAICRRDSIPSILSLVGASLLKMGQVDSSLAYYRKSLRLNPQNPGTVTSISNILLGRKDYDGVIDLTKGFLEEVPDNLSVEQILGVAYYLKDDQDNAYEVFKQLRKDGDESYGTMFYSGMNALSLNRFTVARECFGNAWQIDSTDAKLAWISIGHGRVLISLTQSRSSIHI